MNYNTSDFAELYAIVSSSLKDFIHTEKGDFEYPISDQEEKWFAYLIEVFRQLFHDWEIDQELSDYLDSLQYWPLGSATEVNPIFRLAAHVYLHVAYDLTRGLAITLDATMQVTKADLQAPVISSSFATPIPVIVHSRPDARLLFLRAAPAFELALQSPESIKLLGKLSFWAKFFNFFPEKKRKKILRIMAAWVISLRLAAWIVSETIADVSQARRIELVLKLRDGILKALKRVENRRNITDFEPFPYPSLNVMTMPLLLPFMASLPSVFAAASVVALLALWGMNYREAQRRQKELVAAVDELGAEVLDALTKIIRETSESGEGENTKPSSSVERAALRRLHRFGPPILTLENISLSFGGVRALRDISFDVYEHEILGIVGPNGAGKSSMLNVINGVYQPHHGTITFKGMTRHAMDSHEAAKQGIARTFQNIALFEGMSVFDNIMTGRNLKMKSNFLQQALRFGGAKLKEFENRRKVEQVIDFLEIRHIREEPAERLPYALQKRVGLARALAAEPELLLLDEPMAGLSNEEKQDMCRFILNLNDQFGTTVVVIEHDIGVATAIADRVVVLDHGQKIAEGTPEDARVNRAVVDAYQGS